MLFLAACVAIIVTVAFWHHDNRVLRETRAQVVAGELQPIANLLREDMSLINELRAEPFIEKDSGILESYLAKIRRDGVPKNVEMKKRLDALAENNTAIVTLIEAYAPHAKTPAFVEEGDNFQNYAAAWRERWNSVMELFMVGGNYPPSRVPFPAEFPGVVNQEIAAAK